MMSDGVVLNKFEGLSFPLYEKMLLCIVGLYSEDNKQSIVSGENQ